MHPQIIEIQKSRLPELSRDRVQPNTEKCREKYVLLGMAHLTKTWYLQAQINVLQFRINSPSGPMVASILKQCGFLFEKPKVEPSLTNAPSKKTLKILSIFSSENDSNMRSQKVRDCCFLELLAQRVECGAQGVPKGCPEVGKWYPRRSKMVPQGCQKPQNGGSRYAFSWC